MLKKISIPQLVLEFISVVFAVLLALGLNSYKENIDQKETAHSIKNAVLSECNKNLKKIDSLKINNEDYYNYLDSLISLERDDVDNISFNYSIELLTSAAWNIAQNNDAANLLGQQFLLDAADIYETQNFYSNCVESFFDSVGDYLILQDQTPPYDVAMSLYFGLHVIKQTSEDLKSKYETFLSNYEEEQSE